MRVRGVTAAPTLIEVVEEVEDARSMRVREDEVTSLRAGAAAGRVTADDGRAVECTRTGVPVILKESNALCRVASLARLGDPAVCFRTTSLRTLAAAIRTEVYKTLGYDF